MAWNPLAPKRFSLAHSASRLRPDCDSGTCILARGAPREYVYSESTRSKSHDLEPFSMACRHNLEMELGRE